MGLRQVRGIAAGRVFLSFFLAFLRSSLARMCRLVVHERSVRDVRGDQAQNKRSKLRQPC